MHNTRGHQLRFLPPTTRGNSYHNSFFSLPQSDNVIIYKLGNIKIIANITKEVSAISISHVYLFRNIIAKAIFITPCNINCTKWKFVIASFLGYMVDELYILSFSLLFYKINHLRTILCDHNVDLNPPNYINVASNFHMQYRIVGFICKVLNCANYVRGCELT